MADYWCKMSAVLGLPREALEFVRQVEAALDGDGDFPADLTAGERELLDDCGRSRADFSWDEDDRAIWVHGGDVIPRGSPGSSALRSGASSPVSGGGSNGPTTAAGRGSTRTAAARSWSPRTPWSGRTPGNG